MADVLFMCQMLNGDKSWSDKSTLVPHYQKMTMGWLKNRIYEATTLPPMLQDRLEEVCEIRNELAHRFFKQRIDMLLTRDGYGKLINEIEAMYGKIEDVIRDFHTINALHGEPLGYSEGAIERVTRDLANYLASLPNEERAKFEEGNGRQGA